MREPKLSDLMTWGSAVTEPIADMYRTTDNEACALGCVLVVYDIWDPIQLPQDIRDVLFEVIETNRLPADIQAVMPPGRERFRLEQIILETNDRISRHRAIQLTAELGY